MAYSKLSHQMVDKVISALGESLKWHLVLSVLDDRRQRRFCVRTICDKSGISRTTFYRWMREYQAIPALPLRTERQQLLYRFGRAVDAAFLPLSKVPPASLPAEVSMILEMEKVWLKITRDREDNEMPQCASSEDAISKIETLTDELTGGIKCVEFREKIH